MNLKQLIYFVAIADSGSMSAAAYKVRIAQSAISSQVALLEEELGAKLIVRHSRGAHFTEAGKIFVEHARGIITSFDAAKFAVKAASCQKCSEIKIGLPSGIASTLILPFMEFMAVAAPRVELQILEGLNSDVKGWLDNNEVDIAVLYQTDKKIPKGALPLSEDELVLGGPIIDDVDGLSIPFSKLRDIPLAGTARSHGVRAIVDNIARRMGIALTVSTEIDSTYQLKAMVLRGKCHCILPRSLFQSDTLPKPIRLYKITNPNLVIRSVIVPSAKSVSSTLTSKVTKSLKTFVEKRIANGEWSGGRIYRF